MLVASAQAPRSAASLALLLVSPQSTSSDGARRSALARSDQHTGGELLENRRSWRRIPGRDRRRRELRAGHERHTSGRFRKWPPRRGRCLVPMVAAVSARRMATERTAAVLRPVFRGAATRGGRSPGLGVLNWIYLGSALLASSVAALLAGLSILRWTRWSLDRSIRLSRAIRSIRPDSRFRSQSRPLSPRRSEAIRAALWALLQRSQALPHRPKRFAANAAPRAAHAAHHHLRRARAAPRGPSCGRRSSRAPTLARTARFNWPIGRTATGADDAAGRKLKGEAVALSDVLQDLSAQLPAESEGA